MKSFQLESSALQELSREEQENVSGGVGLVLLAALGGLLTAYNLGKAVGSEAYTLTHE